MSTFDCIRFILLCVKIALFMFTRNTQIYYTLLDSWLNIYIVIFVSHKTS